MRKVAFFGIPGYSRYTFANAMPHSDGMPRSSGADIDNLLELYGETGNKGNMLHGEAPTRIFQVDRSHSCYVSARSLIVDSGWRSERVGEELSKHFDLVVFSTANLIRPDINPGGTAKILESLKVDFVVLGMGMQNPLPPDMGSLHPKLIDLLKVCNDKARVFGVRGEKTEAWLKSVGFDNAKALGCPSFYVYPQNTLNMPVPDPAQVKTAITGGYISAKIPRSKALIDLFQGFEAHYVMQDEVAELKERLESEAGSENLYNDVTGEVHKGVMERVLDDIHYRSLPFKSYRWFQDPNTWRMFASQCDVYIGDRLHGGVAALQSGVPSVLISEDQRVDEVADFIGLPRTSVNDIKGAKAQDIVSEYLAPQAIEKFKSYYHEKFTSFQKVFEDLDIPLTVSQSYQCSGENKEEIKVTPRKRTLKTRLRRFAAKMGY